MAKFADADMLDGLDFTTKEKASENAILSIPINQIETYHNHTFNVNDDDEMKELAESIKKYGILEPLIVRKINDTDNKYELISGHRRKMASEKVGLKTVPAIIKELENNDADIYMVDANLYRENITLTEKVRSYRVKYDAIKNKNENAYKELIKSEDLSRTNAYRFLRLSYLIPLLLSKVERKEITIDIGVILSNLKTTSQEIFGTILLAEKVKISKEQAEKLIELDKYNSFNVDACRNILFYNSVEKPVNYKKVIKTFAFPKSYEATDEEKYHFIQKLIDDYFSQDIEADLYNSEEKI